MDESTLEDKVQELYRQSKSAEVNRRGELILAFGLGVISLVAFASTSRLNFNLKRRTAGTVSRELFSPREVLPSGAGCAHTLSHRSDVTLSKRLVDVQEVFEGEDEIPGNDIRMELPQLSAVRAPGRQQSGSRDTSCAI